MNNDETKVDEVKTSISLMELTDALQLVFVAICAGSVILFYIVKESEAYGNFFLCLSLLSGVSMVVCGLFNCREAYKILCLERRADEERGIDFDEKMDHETRIWKLTDY